MELDRNELAAQLRRDIEVGKYQAGDKLPGYRVLADRFGAAPNTVGEAVRLLAEEGLVRTKTASRAVVMSPEAESQSEHPIADAREVLAHLQEDIRDMRGRLQQLDDGVADALRKLNGTS